MTTFPESDSTTTSFPNISSFDVDNSKALTTANNNYVSLESFIPTGIEKSPKANPLWSGRKPPIPVGPKVLEPSTFHFKTKGSGADHRN